MDVDQNQVASLVRQPNEGLNVEVKTWFDPRSPDGIARLIKALFALRNRNGGFLLIGFDGVTLEPDRCSLADDPVVAFHQDVVQGAVSRYAVQPFEVAATFAERDGRRYPVIAVPEGVRVPVVVGSDLRVDGGRFLLREGDIFFRTLLANGTPSSARLMPRDLPDLLDICFDNREADIGRFLRRQLGGGQASRLVEALATMIPRPKPDLRQRTTALLDRGDEAFGRAYSGRSIPEGRAGVVDGLTLRVSMIAQPPVADAVPTKEFLRRIDAGNPQYTGWPMWMDTSGFGDADSRPFVEDDAWQALVIDLDGGWSEHLEFLLFDPRGEFFLRRAMQDDVTSKAEAGTALDVTLMVFRVTEAIATGLSVVRAAGWSGEDDVGFGFRWTGLEGRRLISWTNRLRSAGLGAGRSRTAVVETFVPVPLDTPHLALAPHVSRALAPLFSIFGGYQLEMEAIEEAVRQLVERRLPG